MVITIPNAVDVKAKRAVTLIIISVANFVTLYGPIPQDRFAPLHMFNAAGLKRGLAKIRRLGPLAFISIIAVMGDAMKCRFKLVCGEGLIIDHKIMRRQKAVCLRARLTTGRQGAEKRE